MTILPKKSKQNWKNRFELEINGPKEFSFLKLILHEISNSTQHGERDGRILYMSTDRDELIKDLHLEVRFTNDRVCAILRSVAIGSKGAERFGEIKEYLMKNIETQLKSQRSYREIMESREM